MHVHGTRTSFHELDDTAHHLLRPSRDVWRCKKGQQQKRATGQVLRSRRADIAYLQLLFDLHCLFYNHFLNNHYNSQHNDGWSPNGQAIFVGIRSKQLTNILCQARQQRWPALLATQERAKQYIPAGHKRPAHLGTRSHQAAPLVSRMRPLAPSPPHLHTLAAAMAADGSMCNPQPQTMLPCLRPQHC